MRNALVRSFRDRLRNRLLAALGFLALGVLAFGPVAVAAPPAPTELVATDRPWDGGGVVDLSWTAPVVEGLEGFQVWRSPTGGEAAGKRSEARMEALAAVRRTAYENAYRRLVDDEGVAPEDARMQAERAANSALNAASLADEATLGLAEVEEDGRELILVDTLSAAETSYRVKKLLDVGEDGSPVEYRFVLRSIVKSPDGEIEYSDYSKPTDVVMAKAEFLDLTRAPLFIILLLLCGAVLYFILKARSGVTLKIRTIAGLAAVDEAVGRSTEMGRPMLYINGIQDMDEIQTVAGITVLGRVAKTAAEYDAPIEVPTARSLVMSAARETVEASYLTAGRSDAFNPDLIYYVTDEQFGFTAYVSGLIVRDRPAACFYMGSFFAESLILAETGNSVGAIQIAGTANPSQLPFFVAACDYTLIGEEFFAASAYLSGQPEQLGSLKGQDMGKVLVGFVLVVGAAVATLGAVTGSESLLNAVAWFKTTVLSG
ncbi:MAG: DUF6754 domain-containing protein [Planctomycetota bacterium]|nr:DUF6754 domain-containing protein [Planctomycetota bacterium]